VNRFRAPCGVPIVGHKVLVVEDNPSARDSLQCLLVSAGYHVATAKDGFDALLSLKVSLPDVIISDLNMPQMCGFELLSVVRRRFPTVLLIAMSGAFAGNTVPGGVIADAFFAKDHQDAKTLLSRLAELIATSSSPASARTKESAAVWIPRNGNDSNGKPFVVITCPECLRSFPLHISHEARAEILETTCLFCPNTVRYIIDFSHPVFSPQSGPSRDAPAVA
jgi:CheY-like chemotaxis protein